MTLALALNALPAGCTVFSDIDKRKNISLIISPERELTYIFFKDMGSLNHLMKILFLFKKRPAQYIWLLPWEGSLFKRKIIVKFIESFGKNKIFFYEIIKNTFVITGYRKPYLSTERKACSLLVRIDPKSLEVCKEINHFFLAKGLGSSSFFQIRKLLKKRTLHSLVNHLFLSLLEN